MGKKDKFAQLQQSGAASSFQESLVQAAQTVAAIERQQEEQTEKPAQETPQQPARPAGLQEPPRFMRLPNPQIPLQEYNLVSAYCAQFANMTRQDFVELAIIEKLHSSSCMSDEDFSKRYQEILSRPPRGQRKGTKSAIK